MKKKTYINPEMRVVCMPSANILAGSGETPVTPDPDKSTEDQYSKVNNGNGLWDEDGDE